MMVKTAGAEHALGARMRCGADRGMARTHRVPMRALSTTEDQMGLQGQERFFLKGADLGMSLGAASAALQEPPRRATE